VPENTTAVTTVTATDGDLPAQTVTFSITGGADATKFSITSAGVLTFVTAPDFEVPTDIGRATCRVMLEMAEDVDGGTNMQSLSVTGTAVGDHDSAFALCASASVPENTTAVTTVTATDGDLPAQTVTFSITGGADATKFSITSAGVLTFVTAPDFEVPT